jgi:hypothetical protein
MNKDGKLHIAIDFDNTIVKTIIPYDIVGVVPFAIDTIKELHSHGHTLLLWTCRTDENLDAAKKFLSDLGIDNLFCAFNENDPFLIERWENDCRKIGADLYIDDKNLGTPMNGEHVDWVNVRKILRINGIIPLA